MSSDAQLNEDVVGQLKYDPAIDSSRIAVAVSDGVVTLKGAVPSYWQKQEAEHAVRRIRGVRALADDTKVEVPTEHVRDNTDIASAAAAALGWHSELTDPVEVTVRDGWVTLSGKADWQYQRTAAENAVRHLRGARRDQ